jgi:hypothetical protein
LITNIFRNSLSFAAVMVGLVAASFVFATSAWAASLVPLRAGYAFDHPRILVQQRLFGLAHGVTLLAAACVNEPVYREPLTWVYTAWKEQQAAAIEASTRDLARYYFADRAAKATKLDILQALKLKDRLSLKPASRELQAACDTFAEAIKKPRYNLSQQFHLQSLASRLAAATATESRAAACRTMISAQEAARLDESVALWHQMVDAGVADAKAALEQHWDDSQLDGTLDEWLVQARANGKRRVTAEGCDRLSQWLRTKQANPDAAFNQQL